MASPTQISSGTSKETLQDPEQYHEQQEEKKTFETKPAPANHTDASDSAQEVSDIEANEAATTEAPARDMSTFKVVTLSAISKKSNVNDRGIQWIFILLAIYISAWLYGLDTTIAADVQGTVLQRFGQPEKLAWIGVGFPLGSIAIILSL